MHHLQHSGMDMCCCLHWLAPCICGCLHYLSAARVMCHVPIDLVLLLHTSAVLQYRMTPKALHVVVACML